MKSIKLISLSAVALLAVMVGGASVHAAENAGPGDETTNISKGETGKGFVADDIASAKSTAEFTVEAGALTLDAVPDMRFAKGTGDTATNPTIQEIATDDVKLVFQDSAVTKKVDANGKETAKDTYDGNSEKLIRVSDFRGTGAGWKLSAGLSTFSNGKDTLGGTSLSIAVGDNKNAVEIASSSEETGSTPIYVAATDNGMGVNDFTIKADTTLNIKANRNVKKGTYQADLTWILSNTPTTEAAN